MDLIFDIPRVRNFIDPTEGLKPFNQAAIEFSGRMIRIVFGSPTQFELEIRCERPDWQLPSITQIFSQQLPLLSQVEQLELREFRWGNLEWKDHPDMDSSQWLELFRLFVAAQSACIQDTGVPCCKGSPRSNGANCHGSITCASDSFRGRTSAIRTCS